VGLTKTMSAPFKVLYFGLPLGALALLSDGLDLRVACISRVTSPGLRRLRKKMLAREGLVLARPDLDSETVKELLASVKPDLVVSWFWTRRIPHDVITLAPHAFGVHPSLLPRHRGPDPYFWTLARRDIETGVTAHVLTPRYDDGAILSQRRIAVPTRGNSWQLAKALDRPSLALMRETTARYARGETIPPIPQDDEKATDAPAPTDEECEILWEWSVDEVIARVRAAAPDPGAFTGYGDETVVILDARRAEYVPKAVEPGEIVRTREGVIIRAGDGAVVVLEAKLEGEETVKRGAAVAEIFPGIPQL
jgi:methionyl-tRNA formyltransferase